MSLIIIDSKDHLNESLLGWTSGKPKITPAHKQLLYKEKWNKVLEVQFWVCKHYWICRNTNTEDK